MALPAPVGIEIREMYRSIFYTVSLGVESHLRKASLIIWTKQDSVIIPLRDQLSYPVLSQQRRSSV